MANVSMHASVADGESAQAQSGDITSKDQAQNKFANLP